MLGQIGQTLTEIFSFRQKYLNALCILTDKSGWLSMQKTIIFIFVPRDLYIRTWYGVWSNQRQGYHGLLSI